MQHNFLLISKRMNRHAKNICRCWSMMVITFVIIILSSCAQNGKWANIVDWKEFEFDNLPNAEEYPEAGAIILLDEGKMEISIDKEAYQSAFERHRIIKILNTYGQRYSNIAIPYNPQSYVDDIKARTISPEGKINVLDKKNIFDINLYPNFIFYSDQRAKLFTMPSVENGSVVEYRYRVNIPIRTFGHSWSFQDEVPTLISRFTLIQPLEKEIEYRIYEIDLEPNITKAPKGFKSTYVWEARDIPPLKNEFGMPPRNECIAHLALAPLRVKTWEDVSQWYHELADPRIKAGKRIKALASSLTENVESKEDKLRLIYEWIRDQVRYIAVSIGIGGYQPHYAEEVIRNKYGDCKDMSTLLCSLAREVGIEAYEVLVSTWYNGIPDTSLPSPYHFNHVIAYCPSIGDSGVWMDATEKGCPYGKLPWYDQGLSVLVVGKQGEAEILMTPTVLADSNRTLLEWIVELQSIGAAIIEGSTKLWGANATEMREKLYYTSSDARKLWLETYLAKRCSGAKLKSFQITGLYPVNDPLTISYTFHTTTFTIPREQGMVFYPGNILAFDLPDYFRSSNRVHPIQFRYGSKTELNLTVNLPSDLIVNTSLSSDSLSSQFGSAFWTYSEIVNAFCAHVSYCIEGVNVSPENYHEFQNFLDNIRKRDLRDVRITQK